MSVLRRKLRRDLRRQRPQFVAVTVTVFLGITIFAASYDSFQNLEASYAETAAEFRFANLTVQGGDVSAFAEAAAGIEGVEAVATRTVADLPIRIGSHKLLGRLVGVPADGQPAVNELLVIEGAWMNEADGLLVEEHLARNFDLVPGSTVEVLGPDGWARMGVAGIISSPEYIWPARSRHEPFTTPDNFGVVFAASEAAEALGGPVNEGVVYYAGGEPDEVLTEALVATAADAGAAAWFTRAEQPSNSALEEDLRGFEELAVFFPMLFLGAAAMASYVMINRLIVAQRPQIGVLLANGFTRRQVLRHYLWYGAAPGIAGSVPGAIAGVLLARVITGWYTDIISVPLEVVRFYPATLASGLLFGLVATVLAALAPALTASRVQPAEAMRGTAPARRGRRSLVERALPPLPVRWRMPLRGIGRNPRRTVYTILGVVLSMMLILVSWGMLDTINHLLNRQFVDIERQDARVYLAEPFPAVADQLAAVPGVEAVEPTVEIPVTLGAGDATYDTALVVLAPDTEMHRFYEPGGATTTLPDDGLLVGDDLGPLLGVGPGDPVTVTPIGMGVTLTDRVTGFVDEPLGTLAYGTIPHVAAVNGGSLPVNAAMLTFQPGADRTAIRGTISDLPGVAAYQDSQAVFDTIEDYMTLFYGFVGLMLVFGAAMAFALIFNSMTVNIAERSREAATLLAVGTERSTLSRLISSENMMVAALGIPPGLLLGYWTSSLAMASFNSDQFTFDLYIRPTTLLWTAVAILVVAALSQLPGLRAIRRLDIATVVKERST